MQGRIFKLYLAARRTADILSALRTRWPPEAGNHRSARVTGRAPDRSCCERYLRGALETARPTVSRVYCRGLAGCGYTYSTVAGGLGVRS
jgi:hypothetical protein